MPFDSTTFRNVINSKLTSTAETRHGINPANKEANPEAPVSTQDDLNRAVISARAAFKIWSKTTYEERRNAILAYGDTIESNKDDLAALLTQEQGKPISQSLQEIQMAIVWVRTLPTIEIPETAIQEKDGLKIVHRYTPLGVAGAIIPWNFPIMLSLGKIIPAIYTGNSVIVKPSPFTPYCGLKLAELAIPHFPAGVLQALSGGDNLGPMITEHPGIDKISFTGSTLTGRRVMASCAKTLKRLTLELGGNDAAIICDDVDLEKIISNVTPTPHTLLQKPHH